ncbi:Uncharacterized protein FWK35_00028234 [Aphis craccivora]|uniref:HAT C-terminal dimerisation domain-containing protein n=1 Tax=Aphis craccivora TaxID=307492 RepID=A0A6G0XXC7_APHCR|nr:Uncharacterized protein FWK35_00028234 [Aphis craccivora]
MKLVSLEITFLKMKSHQKYFLQKLLNFGCTYIKNVKNFNDCAVFPNLSELVLVVLTLPHSNAGVERVFSMLTDIKTKKRNRLNPNTVKALIRTKLDIKNDNKCCLDYIITEQHLKKFNQCMYDDSDSDEEGSESV